MKNKDLNFFLLLLYRGTVDDTELIDGLVLDQKTSGYEGPKKVEKAKIALIQFCISPPKTDVNIWRSISLNHFKQMAPLLFVYMQMENNVVISDYTQMDRVLKEERAYILNIVKKIKACGCNVLLIQKSILRDAVNELALHFLAKMKIMVIKDIERDDVEFVCKVTKRT